MNIPEFLNKQLGHFGHVVVTPMSLVGFVVMLLVAFVVTEAASRGTARIMKSRGVEPGVRFAVSRLVRYLVSFIVLMVALSSTGIDLGAVLAASTVMMVGIGFGASAYGAGLSGRTRPSVRATRTAKRDILRRAIASAKLEEKNGTIALSLSLSSNEGAEKSAIAAYVNERKTAFARAAKTVRDAAAGRPLMAGP